MGFLSTFNSIGMIFGCMALSLMPEIGFKYNTFFYLCGILIVINILLFLVLWFTAQKVSLEKQIEMR